MVELHVVKNIPLLIKHYASWFEHVYTVKHVTHICVAHSVSISKTGCNASPKRQDINGNLFFLLNLQIKFF